MCAYSAQPRRRVKRDPSQKPSKATLGRRAGHSAQGNPAQTSGCAACLKQSTPQKPCEPRYNLHITGRWVACIALYCFQLPTAVNCRKAAGLRFAVTWTAHGGSREACKPDDEPASRITKCGLMKGSSRTPQGTVFLSYALSRPAVLAAGKETSYLSSSSKKISINWL